MVKRKSVSLLFCHSTYAANHHMLKSKIIKRSAKMQIYKTLTRPVVTYGSKTCTLTKSDENLVRIFERKILRKICGPIQVGDIWRIRNSEELNRFINGTYTNGPRTFSYNCLPNCHSVFPLYLFFTAIFIRP